MNLQTPTLDAAVESLRAEVTGSVSLPGETGYELAIPWNAAVPVAPGAVVAVESAQDIAATVRFAAKLGLRVGVQRTGHGAVPLGSDVLLVHTGRLTECVVDPENRTARIGAGLIWQDVIDAAAPHGLAPLAGSSPAVGVAGFLTGAGIGPMVRTYGLSVGSRSFVRHRHRQWRTHSCHPRRTCRIVLGTARRQGHTGHCHSHRDRPTTGHPLLRRCTLFRRRRCKRGRARLAGLGRRPA